MASNFDPYWEWLKIPTNQQPPHHYRLLGLKPLEADAEAIEAAVDRLVEKMQRLSNGPQVEAAQKILNQVAHARLCFNDPSKKQVYDKQLAARLASQTVRNSTAAPLKPEQNNGSSNSGKTSDSPRKTPAKGSPASPKPRPVAQAKTREGNRQVQRMMVAAIAMLVLGGLVGSLFVRFAVRRPVSRPVAQKLAAYDSDKSANLVSTGKTESLKLTAQTPVPADTALSKTGSPSQYIPQAKDAQPQTNAISTATPAPTPTETPPRPTNGLRTIADMPDTFLPAKSALFEGQVGEVVGLQGEVEGSRSSSSGETTYLKFSAAQGDLIEVRARKKKVSPESLKAFVGKKIRVRGELKKEFGSNAIGLEIDTVEQIEIIE